MKIGIALVHGWALNPATLAPLAAALQHKGFVTELIDLGYFGKPRAANFERAHRWIICGHSYGFLSALRLIQSQRAIASQPRIIATVACNAFLRFPASGSTLRVMRRSLHDSTSAALAAFSTRCGLTSDEYPDFTHANLQRLLEDFDDLTTAREKLPELPTLLLESGCDAVVPRGIDEPATHQANIERRIFAAEDHMLPLRRPDECAEYLANFIERLRIEQSFSAHTATYDRHAVIQQQQAERLITQAARFIGDIDEHIAHIADVGCGTGALARLAAQAFPRAHIEAIDLSPQMLHHAQAQHINGSSITYRLGDAESYTHAQPLDLSVSNFCAQWFSHFPAALRHHCEQSRFLAWSFPITGSFAQWIKLHQACQRDLGLHPLPSEEELRATLHDIAPRRFTVDIQDHEVLFPTALDFLRELRSIGAATPRQHYQPQFLRALLRQCPKPFAVNWRIATVLIEGT